MASFAFKAPSTSEGTWSLRLVVGGLVAVPLAATVVALTERHEAGLAAFLGLVSIVAGGVVAAVAIMRRGERSAFVLATALPWLLAVFLVVGELAFPD